MGYIGLSKGIQTAKVFKTELLSTDELDVYEIFTPLKFC